MNKTIWFGLVGVIPINGNNDLGDSKGAYVNVACKAYDEADFVRTITELCTYFNYVIIEIEDIESQDRLLIVNPDNSEKLELLERIRNGEEFTWGTLHTYPL